MKPRPCILQAPAPDDHRRVVDGPHGHDVATLALDAKRGAGASAVRLGVPPVRRAIVRGSRGRLLRRRGPGAHLAAGAVGLRLPRDPWRPRGATAGQRRQRRTRHVVDAGGAADEGCWLRPHASVRQPRLLRGCRRDMRLGRNDLQRCQWRKQLRTIAAGPAGLRRAMAPSAAAAAAFARPTDSRTRLLRVVRTAAQHVQRGRRWRRR
mmetsp:Transcript_88145/g.246640  ORF Transcript_88145/g.246640 Transcript_88145/m.246640 type:complete len:208 (+) Transcript_88145:590-1213(+)